LLPPCEEAYKIHKIGQNEILGIFTDNSEVVKGKKFLGFLNNNFK